LLSTVLNIQLGLTPSRAVESRARLTPGRESDVRFVPKADITPSSFDDLVGASKQRGWNGEAESGRCLAIDDEFDLRR
jgi:hypothetical protein